MATSDSKFDEFMSGMGYETDPSRMGSESISSVELELGQKKKPHSHAGKQKHTIARKRKVMTDSGYEQDVSSRGIPMNENVDKEEELTQFLPITVGSYVDHSLDPDVDSDCRPFAPIHRKPTFPESLFAMLSNPELSSIITWLPHGRSFIIVDRESLAKNVLPMYFRHNNMSSFTRQLNGYGFMKIRIGPFERSYYHPFLLKNLPHLVKNITREKPKEKSQGLTEAQLEKVSDERPLPLRMKTEYAHHINDMNTMANEGRKAAKAKEEAILREQSSQAPIAASAIPAFSFQQENEVQASFHPIPSVIYTPSPNPLPQVVRTSPQQQPNVQVYQSVGGTQQQQGPHQFLTSGTMLNLPQANLPFFQPQAGSSQSAAASQLNTNVAEHSQTFQDLAAQIQMQAQIQLLYNALAAAQGQSIQLPHWLSQQPQQYTFPQVYGLPQQDPVNQPGQQGVGIVTGPNSLGEYNPSLNHTTSIPTAQAIANNVLQLQQLQQLLQQQQQQQQQPQHHHESANSQPNSRPDNGQQTHET